MEDVLDVYQQPYDPLRPVVCLDETNRQLIEKRSISAKPAILVPQSSAFDISKIKGVFFSRISRRMVFGPEKAKSLLILLAGSRKQIFVAKQRGLILF